MSRTALPTVFDPVQKTLHWTIAFCILALLFLGWMMTGDPALSEATRRSFYGLHKSLGLTVLLLAVLRIAWRVTHRVPALPGGLRPWEIWLAGAVWQLFYVLLVLQPLVGWMLYSLSPHKSLFFGLFPIPDLFSMPQVADVAGWREVLEGLHGFFGAAFAALIVLHVGAALKHHFVLRDAVLLRMAPAFLAPVLRLLRGER